MQSMEVCHEIKVHRIVQEGQENFVSRKEHGSQDEAQGKRFETRKHEKSNTCKGAEAIKATNAQEERYGEKYWQQKKNVYLADGQTIQIVLAWICA